MQNFDYLGSANSPSYKPALLLSGTFVFGPLSAEMRETSLYEQPALQLSPISQPIPRRSARATLRREMVVNPVAHRFQPDPRKGRLRRHFGAWDSGDPKSADNDGIDRDLAAEYESAVEG